MTENFDEIYPPLYPAGDWYNRPEDASLVPPQPRRPGAQPGNQDAFKHGMYSRINPVATAYDIPAEIPPDLQQLFQSQTPGDQGDLQMYDQIALLRTCLLLLRSNLKTGLSMGVLLDYIRAINLTSATLSRLSRTQRRDLPQLHKTSRAEQAMMDRMLARLGLLDNDEEDDQEDEEEQDEEEGQEDDTGQQEPTGEQSDPTPSGSPSPH